MPTVLTHPALPLAVGLGLGRQIISRRLLAAGVATSMLPDLDVLAFPLGVHYGSAFGHRGFTHSLAFALAVALVGGCCHRALRAGFSRAFLFILVATASHGMLDAFTNGGLGIAFLWPFSGERYFAPYPVIEVSPIGISRFLSSRGVSVLESELVWVWAPCAVLGVALAIISARLSKPPRATARTLGAR
ncbi:MAG TPA: metal-dependent hydrolase [Methylomirabilota bacterium]|jgi:inner membrane protein|nr:metal-dependent hydrolase [Methylomirabilota bacterium]